jgi:uncharacterized membrane protein
MTELNPYEPPKSQIALSEQVPLSGELTEPQRVSAGRGWGWIADGFALFKRDPWIWIVNMIILIVITSLLSLVPVGGIAAQILYPLFQGGLMLGCYAQDNGNPLKVEHLFAGFRTNTGSLAAVGGLYLLGVVGVGIVTLALVFLLGGSNLLELFKAIAAGVEQPNPEMVRQGVLLALLAGLIGLALIIPLLMATWFAPALVVFHSLGAVAAMQWSFRGCLRNILPFLVYGLAALVLLVVALIPLGLGLLVLIPILTASVYIAYKDIFLKNT